MSEVRILRQLSSADDLDVPDRLSPSAVRCCPIRGSLRLGSYIDYSLCTTKWLILNMAEREGFSARPFVFTQLQVGDIASDIENQGFWLWHYVVLSLSSTC